MYGFTAVVIAGEGRGRLLGFPTLNLEVGSRRKLLPPHGVYAVRVEGRTAAYGGMMNLGPRPTFGDEKVSLEVHLFDASGTWYGREVSVQFVSRLRDTTKFASAEELIAQLKVDAKNARVALTALVPSAKLNGSSTNTSSLS
jgi:riboflavin kinase/FMN adenylyltransferase